MGLGLELGWDLNIQRDLHLMRLWDAVWICFKLAQMSLSAMTGAGTSTSSAFAVLRPAEHWQPMYTTRPKGLSSSVLAHTNCLEGDQLCERMHL